VDLEKIVTNEYAWTDAPKAFADFAANAGKMLKVVLDFTVSQ
jgi:threonine dehydrogenase-like Zn-dependent dehydrogenase